MFANGRHECLSLLLHAAQHLHLEAKHLPSTGLPICRRLSIHLVRTQAQRLKNEKTRLYETCKKLHTKLRFGLTGTPMQNKHKELYNLLRLCALSQLPACVSAGWALCMQKVGIVLHKHGA